MECRHPQKKSRTNGSTYYHKCGQCLGCRVTNSEEWALRNIAEAQSSKGRSHFLITNTYMPDRLPLTDGGLPTTRIEDVRAFVKRFRKNTGQAGLKFFGCTEYGKKRNRPHMHVLLLHIDLAKIQKLPAWRPKPADIEAMDSAGIRWRNYDAIELQILKAWQCQGQIDVKPFNHNRAAYVAKYLVKGDVLPGELHPDQEPEDRTMSKGLGKSYVDTVVRTFKRCGLTLPEVCDPKKRTVDLSVAHVRNGDKLRSYPIGKYLREKIILNLGGDNRTEERKLFDQVTTYKASLLAPFDKKTGKAEKAERITRRVLLESGDL